MKKFSFVLIAMIFAVVSIFAAHSARAAQQSTAPTPKLTKQQEQAQNDIKLGDLAVKNHAAAEAIADYKAAVLADPSSQDAHTNFVRYSIYPPRPEPAKKKAAARNKNEKLTKEQQAAQKAKEEAKQKQLEAYQKKTREKRTAKLLSVYDHWIKKNPKQAMFYWGKAQIFEDQNNNAQARVLLHQAITADANCAPAYADLSDLAAVDGNVAEQRQYAEKALALDPADKSGVFFNYALTYLTTEPPKYRQLVEDRVAQYPKDLDYLLMLVAENAPTLQEEEAAYEKIYQVYGPQSAHPSDDLDGMMPQLFNLYATNDAAKALSFAQQMQKDEAAALAKKAAAEKQSAAKPAAKAEAKDAKPQKPLWQSIADYQKSIVDAQSLIAQKKYSDALALLAKNDLKPENDSDPFGGINKTPYELVKAQALAGGGQAQKAYDNIKTALLPQPDDSLQAALVSYGAKLGKTPAQVREDVWQTRDAKAKAFVPFNLKQYVTNKEVKLADYRGRVVLVNFWFPG